MRECEEMLKIVHGCRDSWLDSWVTRDWQAAKVGTRVEHAGELKSHASCCTTRKKSQAGQTLSSWLELVTQPSHEVKSPDHLVWEKVTFHIPFSPYYIYTLIPTKCRKLLKRILRETLEKNKINSSTIFT